MGGGAAGPHLEAVRLVSDSVHRVRDKVPGWRRRPVANLRGGRAVRVRGGEEPGSSGVRGGAMLRRITTTIMQTNDERHERAAAGVQGKWRENAEAGTLHSSPLRLGSDFAARAVMYAWPFASAFSSSTTSLGAPGAAPRGLRQCVLYANPSAVAWKYTCLPTWNGAPSSVSFRCDRSSS